VPVKDIDSLPSTAGVYYFYDQRNKIIYVGKATNLQKEFEVILVIMIVANASRNY
jgi:hypothetical protein